MKSYTDLEVWIEARKLVNSVYLMSKGFPNSENYGMTSQIRRCVVSVPSNIAEGCGRQSSKETIYFLHISRGSLFELETQIYLSFDQKYITKKELDLILEQIVLCKKLVNGFINYFKRV